ncbi:MAG TPA: tetratricopeptide repeat protein, partial [Armatimonadota bacterium]|nr:tetratricopeptide repeat protein [Armatimonadota bacterium]
ERRGSPWANDALQRLSFIRENLDGKGRAEGDYLTALVRVDGGDLDGAEKLLRGIADVSSEPLADDARMLLGGLRAERGDPAGAVAIWEGLAADMPDSLLAPEAMLRAADTRRDALGDLPAARRSLEALVQGYPDSAAADQARQLLDTMPGGSAESGE